MQQVPGFDALKARQRAIRAGFPQTMGLRVHRAISWIGRAEASGADHDARFLFDRLHVLRNQLVHGGATWNSAVNRARIRDGAAILATLMPIFVDIMMDAPDADWDRPFHPVVDA